MKVAVVGIVIYFYLCWRVSSDYGTAPNYTIALILDLTHTDSICIIISEVKLTSIFKFSAISSIILSKQLSLLDDQEAF